MTSQPNSPTATQPKAYKTPSLTKYGQLKDLTTGGSGGKNENGKGDNNPNKKI